MTATPENTQGRMPERIELPGGWYLKKIGEREPAWGLFQQPHWGRTCEMHSEVAQAFAAAMQSRPVEASPLPGDERVDALRKALEEAISNLASVEKDTYYQFDTYFTPEEERLVERLKRVVKESYHCPTCKDGGWVCEKHENKAWPESCNCSAGMSCKCNLGSSKKTAATAIGDLRSDLQAIAAAHPTKAESQEVAS